MYLIIDNYDSFTYNLFQYLSVLTTDKILVFRNDEINSQQIKKYSPKGIIISPGPGRPTDGGNSIEIIKNFSGCVPILGVCLGHQCIAEAFGAKIVEAKMIVHGKVDQISHDQKGLFRNIPSPATFTRYHSLVVEKESLPKDFEITATSSDGDIMGLRHKKYLLEGIQFHPESISSKYGKQLLRNFISYKREPFFGTTLLNKIIKKKDLSFDEAEYFMDEITCGNLTNAQIAGFLVALNSKGFSSSEIAGCASILRKKMVSLDSEYKLLDTCGTGGDSKSSFNVSSISAIVAAACGAKVAKHGNRSVTSKSGSADFFSFLGYKTDPKIQEKMIKKTGFAFLFAPFYHNAMKYVAKTRSELGIKTIMNLIGPLSNPANASYQIIGVYDKSLMEKMGLAAKRIGVERVLVVCSDDGLDEVSTSSKTYMVKINEDDKMEKFEFHPNMIGLKTYTQSDIVAKSINESCKIAKDVLNNVAKPAQIQTVLLNSAAALWICGIANDLADGYKIAKNSIENKIAKSKLDQIVKISRELS